MIVTTDSKLNDQQLSSEKDTDTKTDKNLTNIKT